MTFFSDDWQLQRFNAENERILAAKQQQAEADRQQAESERRRCMTECPGCRTLVRVNIKAPGYCGYCRVCKEYEYQIVVQGIGYYGPEWKQSAMDIVDQRKSRAAMQPAPSETPPAEDSTQRLIVDIKRLTVALDGQTYDVASAQALRWLKVLCDHPGDWIPGEKLKSHDPELDGARTDRLKKKLPVPVQSLIDSETGKGSRLLLA